VACTRAEAGHLGYAEETVHAVGSSAPTAADAVATLMP
jgi:hypothetical protein